MNLFDPDPYTVPGHTPRTLRAEKSETPPEQVTVVIGERWGLFSTHRSPQAHARYDGFTGTGTTRRRVNTLCGKSMPPLTVDPGVRAAACPDCLAKGARP